MKKLTLAILGCAFFALASCSEDENPFETKVGTAVIEGKVQFDDNLTDGEEILVPASGASIKITYSSEDLSYSGSNGVDVTKVIDVVVGDDGRFTAEVPAIANSVSFRINSLDYLTQYIGYNDESNAETKTGYYSASSLNLALVEGETKYVTIKYSFNSEF